ncbi:MAG: tRNA glutamyl-Q(34) synthetase GluQRS [Thiobacillaceae bacterium]
MGGLETYPGVFIAPAGKDLSSINYVGRFAPSPTGPLHFGSLVAALGSYLDARSHRGAWLVRIEDIDSVRCGQAHADHILRLLEAFGLEWTGAVLYQSGRRQRYGQALEFLIDRGYAYPCACTRKEIADSALHGVEGPVYRGTCRGGLRGRAARTWRVRTNACPVSFVDRLQGHQCQSLEVETGDFVVWRADDVAAYQLAVVVDDAEQAVTHVVRGADLLASTQRQIYLQSVLGFPTPDYLHLPIVLNEAGQKLSKQTFAPPINEGNVRSELVSALNFLGFNPDRELLTATVQEILVWGTGRWSACFSSSSGLPAKKRTIIL